MSNKGGWFRVWRHHWDELEHDEPLSRREAWLWLLRYAAYQPTTIKGQQTRGKITLQPGEFHCAVRFLAKAWKWTKSKVHRELSSHEKWGRLERLERDGNTVYRVISGPLTEPLGEPLDTLETCEKHSERGTPNGTVSGTNKREGRSNSSLHKEPVPEGAQVSAPDGADLRALSREELERVIAALEAEKQNPQRPMRDIWRDMSRAKTARHELNQREGANGCR